MQKVEVGPWKTEFEQFIDFMIFSKNIYIYYLMKNDTKLQELKLK